MKLRPMNELPTSRDMIEVFGGYNHNLRIGSGEFYDMKNLTSDNYPTLSPRKQRGVFVADDEPLAMIAKDAVCFLQGSPTEELLRLIIVRPEKTDRVEIPGGWVLAIPDKRRMVSMGNNVLIFPDGIYVNITPDGNYECGKIEAVFESEEIAVRLCFEDGEEYGDPYPFEENIPPHDPDKQPYWLDFGEFGDPLRLKRYYKDTNEWVEVPETYIKLCATGIGSQFQVGDAVDISNFVTTRNQKLSGTHVIVSKTKDEIVIKGILLKGEKLKQTARIARELPLMDFVTESGNRLWGCRFGVARNGEFVNEIYASALGDFKNWNRFEGISTDSYVASVGSDGAFTGAITLGGYPIFFKENCMHKIYGNYPSNYQIQTTACRGVQQGCDKSLAIVNEMLYYKARSGVCVYDGSLPVEISQALGDEAYTDAAAGGLGNKYYISMKDARGEHSLFVYDTSKGMWHREDATQVTEFCNFRGELYFIDYSTKQIHTVGGTGELLTKPVEWEAITGIIGTDSPDKKYISRLDVRMLLALGSQVEIYAEYDSMGDWELLLSRDGVSLRSFAIPVRPKRCDHLRLKICGRGDAKIFSICKTIEQGSDV